MFSQKNTVSEIDSLLFYRTETLIGEKEFQKAIALNQKVIKQSEDLGYIRGAVWGNINLGRIFTWLGKFDESLKYLRIAKQNKYTATDPYIAAMMYFVYGRNYNLLGFIQKSNENYDKAVKLGNKIKDIDRKNFFLSILYGNKGQNFFNRKEDRDSLFFCWNKSYKLYPNPNSAADLSAYFLKYGNTDSATIYLQKADSLFDNGIGNYLINKRWILENYALLYFIKKDYEKSLDYYQLALALAIECDHKKGDVRVLYKMIAETYSKLNNEEKSSEYIRKYTILNDSIQELEKSGLNTSIRLFMKEIDEEDSQEENTLYLVIVGIVLSCLGITIWAYQYDRKTKMRLIEKNEILLKQESEFDILKERMTVTSEEILQLAKGNDPSFLMRFQNLYPEFCEKLLETNSKLSNGDLTLCALIKLNFSSKDIACFNFVQLNTIHMKKYRLKKKLGISEETSLYHYLKDI